MPPVRYLITGGSGYIGGRLTDELSGREETEKIVDVGHTPDVSRFDGARPEVNFLDLLRAVANEC